MLSTWGVIVFIIVAVIAFVFLFKHFTYSPDTPFTNITVPTSTTEDPFVDLDIDVIGEGASFTSITQGKYPQFSKNSQNVHI
jgi:hypothetical protein